MVGFPRLQAWEEVNQALLHEPDVVFLDEPTSGLDPRAARTVLDVIAELTDDGHTVFLSTHILSVVEELADVVGDLYVLWRLRRMPPGTLMYDVDLQHWYVFEPLDPDIVAEVNVGT
ncbi:hypothetical protein JCM17823_06040 [Halorubrum gandharaense]